MFSNLENSRRELFLFFSVYPRSKTEKEKAVVLDGTGDRQMFIGQLSFATGY